MQSKKNIKKILIFLLLLFIVIRLIFILKSDYVFNEEENKHASMASDMYYFGKFKIPFFMYLDTPHAGGGQITSLLLIPIFFITGPRIISIKLLGIIISAFWFLILLKIFAKIFESKFLKSKGERFQKSNFIFIFLIIPLFIISSPHLLYKSLFIIGNTNLFILMIVLSLFFVINYHKLTITQFLFLFGIFNGIALYSNYSYLSILVVNLAFVIDRIIKTKIIKNNNAFVKLKLFLLFCLGFIISLFPYIIYNIIYKLPSIFAEFAVSALLKGISTNISLEFIFTRFIKTLISLIQSYHFINISLLSSKIQSYVISTIIIVTIIITEITRLKHKRFFKVNKNNILDFTFFITRLYFISSFLLISIFNIHLHSYGFSSTHQMAHYYVVHLQFLLILYFYLSFISIYRRFFNKIKKQIKTFNIYKIITIIIITSILFLNFGLTILNDNFNEHIFLKQRFDSNINAYESGFNFVNNEQIFILGLNKLKEDVYKENYIKGAVHRLIRVGNKEKLSKTLLILNDSNKKIFIDSYNEFITISELEGINNTITDNPHSILAEINELNK